MKLSPQTTRLIQTANINFAVFCLGLSSSSYGATLLDLAELYHTNVESVSYTLTTLVVGSVLGGLFGSVAFRLCNSQLVMIICILLGGLCTITLPLWPDLVFLHVVSFLLGFMLPLIDIGAHVWLQVIWKQRSGPLMQLYNLIFGIGGIAAPFICEPFLSSTVIPVAPVPESGESDGHVPSSSLSLNVSLLLDGGADNAVGDAGVAHTPTRIAIAYGLIGLAFLVNMVLFLVSYLLDSTDVKPNEVSSSSPSSSSSAPSSTVSNELPKKPRCLIVALLAVYMMIGVADEVMLASYLPTFVVRNPNLRFNKSSGAYLSSAFWLSYTVSRLVTTLLTFRLSPAKLIVLSHTILVAATVTMSTFANASPTATWASTIMVAFGLSPFFGNGTIWAVQYMLLSHVDMSALLVFTCVGAMVPGLVMGPLIDSWPLVFLWSHAVVAFAMTAVAVGLVLYGRTPQLREIAHRRRADNNTDNRRTADVPLTNF